MVYGSGEEVPTKGLDVVYELAGGFIAYLALLVLIAYLIEKWKQR